MASKVEVLRNQDYADYIMISMITVSRNIIAEATNIPFHAARVVAARQILQNPLTRIGEFKSLAITLFDTSTWESLTEAQKISGGVSLVGQVFNEAMYIF